jgi:lysophospholipase L1-like esterase
LIAGVAARPAAAAAGWVGTWASSQQIPEPANALPPQALRDATLRQIVHLTVGGKELRVRLSNAFGTEPLTILAVHVARPVSKETGSIDAATDRALTFAGSSSVTIPAGADYFSDPIAFDAPALSDLAITLYLEVPPERQTSHPGSRETSFLVHGDHVADAALPGATTVAHWFLISGVDVRESGRGAAIVTLGDSITDGHAVPDNSDGRWPDALARRLQSSPATRGLSVLNVGTGGNRLLLDGAGPNALARFDRDVLAQTGARYLILLEGINDLGSATRLASISAAQHAVLVHQIIGAYEQIILRAHAHGITVIGGTITPDGGSDYYHPSAASEADRQAVNAWIRQPGHFDAVLDFDHVVGDPKHAERLLPGYDSGDHLHPSPAGYRAMAAAIPLQLFAAAPPVTPTAEQPTAEQDHSNMMEQLGIRAERPGASGDENDPDHANYDELLANPYPILPDPLKLDDGGKVTTAGMWWRQRRPQIVSALENDVYGHIPKDVPKVMWHVAGRDKASLGGHPIVYERLIGHVDNSGYPAISVDIPVTLVLPAKAKGRVPVLIMFWFGPTPVPPTEPSGGELGQINGALRSALERADPALDTVFRDHPGTTLISRSQFSPLQRNADGDPPSIVELIAAGWGFAVLDPTLVQADSGSGLTRGIIGLTNKGQPRTPDQWGALRAWAWAASRTLDYLDTDPAVDGRAVGIEGVSRYGKAALVTLAFDQRFAMGLIGSSGRGGAALLRRNFGETLENLTGSGEYHWMAGNFLEYGAAKAVFGPRNPGDLPVDAHDLIALCAPRLVFVSYGLPAMGDARWVDQRGGFMAAVAATPVYRLLGAEGLDVTGSYLTARMPPVNQGLLDGQLAWRQDDGGHTDAPNMKYFIGWAERFIHYRHSQGSSAQ